jgi:hypothetical protein
MVYGGDDLQLMRGEVDAVHFQRYNRFQIHTGISRTLWIKATGAV